MCKAKLRVYHACPVNSITIPVLLPASLVKRIPFHLIKIGPFPAINVPPVVPANKAALNVPIVHLVNIKIKSTAKKCALHVLLDTNRKLKTHTVVINVVPVTKVNSVHLDPACVFFAILVNFNSDLVHANSVQLVRMPVIKE